MVLQSARIAGCRGNLTSLPSSGGLNKSETLKHQRSTAHGAYLNTRRAATHACVFFDVYEVYHIKTHNIEDRHPVIPSPL